ncbi:MAG: FAD-binding oxidoreductase [Lachnospiraceae bacterium]
MVKKMENEKLILSLGGDEEAYLQDESKYEGMAYSISFPKTEVQVAEVVRTCMENHDKITIQGALTGITGAGVPVCGHVMNMKHMNQFFGIEETDSIYYAKVEAGITMEELEREIRRETNNQYFFPIVPTEKTATIGGVVASGASGLQSYSYGDIEKYIEEITLCDSKGLLRTLKKEELKPYIRSEGMLGIITKVTLRLVRKPECLWGILFLFSTDQQACEFADRIVQEKDVTVLEYLDYNTIEVIKKYQNHMSSIAELPEIPMDMRALIYVEIAGMNESGVETCAMHLIEQCVESGGNPDIAWAMTGETELEPIRAYRHAASECVNMEISAHHGRDKRIKKLSVDVKWNTKSRKEIIMNYQKDLKESGLQYCIFGHLGTKQPYVNIIAKDGTEYQKGKILIKNWIIEAYAEQGEVFHENGIGKLKKEYFCDLAPIEAINYRLKSKAKWDPQYLFNPKNMFEESVL